MKFEIVVYFHGRILPKDPAQHVRTDKTQSVRCAGERSLDFDILRARKRLADAERAERLARSILRREHSWPVVNASWTD